MEDTRRRTRRARSPVEVDLRVDDAVEGDEKNDERE